MSHESTNEITCPYCDHEFLDSWDSGVGGCEEEIECESCEEMRRNIRSERQSYLLIQKEALRAG